MITILSKLAQRIFAVPLEMQAAINASIEAQADMWENAIKNA